MTATAYVKKLDAENLQILLHLNLSHIHAEEATTEAIVICRMMGVALLLAPGEPRMNDATRVICKEGRKLGVCVVLAASDLSGLKSTSSEEAEKILDNTAIKIRRDSASPEASGTDGNNVSGALAKELAKAGYISGQTYEQCLEMAKWHPAMAEFMTKRLPGEVGSDTHRRQFGFAQMYLLGGGLAI